MNIREVLDVLGIKIYNRNSESKDFNVRCISGRHADIHPSCFIDKKTGIWYCFSCGAGGNFKKLVKIVSFAKGISTKSVDGIDLDRTYYEDLQERLRSDSNILFPKEFDLKSIGAHLLIDNKNHPAYDYLVSRGVWEEQIEEYAMCYSTNGKRWSDRVIIPIISYSSSLCIGAAGRLFTKSKAKVPKYLYTSGFKNSENLFFNTLRSALSEAFIVEGIFDQLALERAGLETGYALLGSRITPGKINIILHNGHSVVTLVLDGDQPGILASQVAAKSFSGWFIVKVASLPIDKDPDTCSPSALRRVCQRAVIYHGNDVLEKVKNKIAR